MSELKCWTKKKNDGGVYTHCIKKEKPKKKRKPKKKGTKKDDVEEIDKLINELRTTYKGEMERSSWEREIGLKMPKDKYHRSIHTDIEGFIDWWDRGASVNKKKEPLGHEFQKWGEEGQWGGKTLKGEKEYGHGKASRLHNYIDAHAETKELANNPMVKAEVAKIEALVKGNEDWIADFFYNGTNNEIMGEDNWEFIQDVKEKLERAGLLRGSHNGWSRLKHIGEIWHFNAQFDTKDGRDLKRFVKLFQSYKNMKTRWNERRRRKAKSVRAEQELRGYGGPEVQRRREQQQKDYLEKRFGKGFI
jgi:hypothetical protein